MPRILSLRPATPTDRPTRAARVFVVFTASSSLLFALMSTLLLLFQVEVAHLDPTQLVVVGTVLEATCFLGEVPTSVVADVWSRRVSVLVGLAVMGVGTLLQAGASFTAILVAQVVWGLGYTCVSGAVDAWVADEVGPTRVQPVFTRATQAGLAAGFGGTVLAGVLGVVDLRLPLLVSGGGFLALAAWLVCTMHEERAGSDAPGRASFRELGRTFRDGLRASRRSRVVRGLVAASLLAGLSTEVFDRLWTAHVVRAFGVPRLFGVASDAAWFTVFALVGSALALVTSLAVNRRRSATLRHTHPHRLLAGLTAAQVLGVAGFAVGGSLLPALGAMWLRDAARAVAQPVQAAWLHRSIDSRTRATVASITGQADALGQVVGGPPLGALASRTSVPLALLVSAAVYAPAVEIFRRLRAR